ncbi:MAG: putative bacterial RNA polymerase [Prokaryotic dsDNA virus sp.]|nr:MAG: putative bacterial RNA polymerase [Prokaryotic dsDNA virus sp.]|tara:strand:+ start:10121 stop:11032 length:912 start_codon:yes stop_codon:yes gene_type:complete
MKPNKKFIYQRIRDNEFSTRVTNCLEKNKIYTVLQLVQMKPHELLALRNFRFRSLRQVEEVLKKHKLKLGMSRKDARSLKNDKEFERMLADDLDNNRKIPNSVVDAGTSSGNESKWAEAIGVNDFLDQNDIINKVYEKVGKFQSLRRRWEEQIVTMNHCLTSWEDRIERIETKIKEINSPEIEWNGKKYTGNKFLDDVNKKLTAFETDVSQFKKSENRIKRDLNNLTRNLFTKSLEDDKAFEQIFDDLNVMVFKNDLKVFKEDLRKVFKEDVRNEVEVFLEKNSLKGKIGKFFNERGNNGRVS